MKILKTLVLAVALGVLTGCNNPPPPVPVPKPVPVTPVPTPPPVPIPTPTPTPKSVTLTWDSVSNAQDYLVERDDMLIGSTSGMNFVDHGIVGSHLYAVSARNPAGISPMATVAVTV